jgi:hypothetical protein
MPAGRPSRNLLGDWRERWCSKRPTTQADTRRPFLATACRADATRPTCRQREGATCGRRRALPRRGMAFPVPPPAIIVKSRGRNIRFGSPNRIVRAQCSSGFVVARSSRAVATHFTRQVSRTPQTSTACELMRTCEIRSGGRCTSSGPARRLHERAAASGRRAQSSTSAASLNGLSHSNLSATFRAVAAIG